jgi:hypothetical protein
MLSRDLSTSVSPFPIRSVQPRSGYPASPGRLATLADMALRLDGSPTVGLDQETVHSSPGWRGRRPDPAPWVVAAIALGLRLATAAQGPTDWDSAQYASAVGHFDVTHGQPQPPGYWLYIETGRVVRALTGLGTVHSLVVVAALASAAAAGLTTAAGRALGGRWLGVAAGAIVATSPFVWFSGSIVATYSFDALAGAALLLLAWNARPGSWHGVGAVATLGLITGFRPSALQAFALLALVPVVAATRSWRRALATVATGLVSVAVWFLPMIAQQPGGFSAWLRATRAESTGAFQATSILDHAAGGHTNLGTFAAYTVVALAPVAVLSVLAGAVLGVRYLLGRSRPTAAIVPDPPGVDAPHPESWSRPWYQRRTAVLTAAILPPAAIVGLVQFAKGGYLLAYVPAAVIALLLPVNALLARRPSGAHASRSAGRHPTTVSSTWLVLASLGVAVVVGIGSQRFLAGDGVLPQRWLRAAGGVWLQQPQYQAPYTDTRQAITGADAIDTALGRLGPMLHPAGDVVVFDTVDGGDTIYRNAGWSLPNVRISLITTGTLLYNQLHGALYYASGNTVAAGLTGSVYLVASPALPGMATLTASGEAIPVSTPLPIGGYLVWRLLPGTTLLGVHIATSPRPPALGGGI